METTVWIFYNIFPWIGLLYLVLIIIFFAISLLSIFFDDDEEYDLKPDSSFEWAFLFGGDFSFITAVVPMIIIFVIALIGKGVKKALAVYYGI